MDLATTQFWDNFYQEPREEWYFPFETVLPLLESLLDEVPYPVVVHGGCGNCLMSKILKCNKLLLLEFDISSLAFHQSEKDLHFNIFIANILSLPIQSNSVDVVVEKGLFDSLTSTNHSASFNAYKMISEYDRILRSKGFAMIFSIFGPGSAKDTIGLLYHPNFTVECVNIFTSPAEIPSQDFCFLYILRKRLLI